MLTDVTEGLCQTGVIVGPVTRDIVLWQESRRETGCD